MANKKAVLKDLADYFAKKGMLSPSEYKAADDAPMRYMVAKRAFGSWARMIQMAKTAGFDEGSLGKSSPSTMDAPKPKAKPAPKKAEKGK